MFWTSELIFWTQVGLSTITKKYTYYLCFDEKTYVNENKKKFFFRTDLIITILKTKLSKTLRINLIEIK